MHATIITVAHVAPPQDAYTPLLGKASIRKEASRDGNRNLHGDVSLPTDNLYRSQSPADEGRHSEYLWSRSRRWSVFIRKTLLVVLPETLHSFLDVEGLESKASRNRDQHESKSPRPTAFLDGMRGLAAFCVMFFHFALPFYPKLLHSYDGAENASLLQLPIIRLFYNGSPMVSIFFVISGIVLSLKPMKMIREGDDLGSAYAIESAIFRRPIRLFGPSLIASFGIMIGAHLHMFDMLRDVTYHGDAALGRYFWPSQPKYIPGALAQFRDWMAFVKVKLIFPESWQRHYIEGFTDYGAQFWTIPVEFWSSMLLFLTLMAFGKLKTRPRNTVFLTLAAASLTSGGWDVGLFLCGPLIADMPVFRSNVSTLRYHRVLWGACFCSGLTLASFPDSGGKQAPGYAWLAQVHGDFRFWQSIAALMIVISTAHMQAFRNVFENTVCQYLGRISYSLYIIHMPVLSSFGWALVPMWQRILGQPGDFGKSLAVIVSFVILLPLQLWLSDVFLRLVDKPCTRGAHSIERYLESHRQS